MPTSRKWILIINLLVIAVIYVLAANTSDGQITGFFLSLFHSGANLALAIICLLIYVIQRIRGETAELLLSLVITFLLSGLLVGLLSFPTCILIDLL
jgi:cytochrome bd-type quinol oxidase subunit 2